MTDSHAKSEINKIEGKIKLFSQKSRNPWSRTYQEAGRTLGWFRTRSPPPSGVGSPGIRPFWEGSS